jgi:hypothetical protein
VRRPALLVIASLAGVAQAAPGLDLPVPAPDPQAAARLVLGWREDARVTDVTQSLTAAHVHVQQLAADGRPLLGASAAVHVAGRAPRYRVRGLDALGPRVAVVGVRRLDEAAARARALAAVPGALDVAAAEEVAEPTGPGAARPAVWLAVDASGPRLYSVVVDADDGRVSVGCDLLVRATGSGRVYRTDPISESGDRTLMDNGDADSDELTALRQPVMLLGLDGSGYLRGEYVDAHRTSDRLQDPSLVFDAVTRGQPGFEEISAYYHVDHAQRHLQALGFSGASAIYARPLDVVTDWMDVDQSYYDPLRQRLYLGTGGVDDGEDGDVVIHEYGHGLQFQLTHNYGTSGDAMALGEGWGDILAFATPSDADPPDVIERECLAPWDASAYKPPAPCMRRVDGIGHLPEALQSFPEPHYDGELWSATLHDFMTQPDIGVDEGLRILVESLFLYAADESFEGAAAKLVTAEQMLTSGRHAATLRRVLVWHGFLSTPSLPGPETAVLDVVNSSVVLAGGSAVDTSQTLSAPGAGGVRVHFASISLETGFCRDALCDAVYLYGRDGNLYARLGGSQSDVKAPIVPGDEVVVRLVTHPGSQAAGVKIDRYEVLAAPPAPDAGVDAPPPDAALADAPPPDAPPDATPAGAPDATVVAPRSGGCAVVAGTGRGDGALAGLLVAALALRRRPGRGARVPRPAARW